MEHTFRKISTVFFFILLFLQFATAQIKTEPNSSTFNTILFKVTSPDHAHVSYLFGTHHAFGKPFFDSLTKANEALTSCNLLIKENLNIPGKMAEDIINKRPILTKWKKYLNTEDLAFIKTLFATSPTDFNKMTPTELYVFLNRYFKQHLCLNKTTDDVSLSLDDYIGSKATKQAMQLYGLETTEEQIDLINKDVEGMPKRTHQRRLSNIISRIRTGNVASCEETTWYSQMEIDYQLNAPCRNALMLTNRNASWMTVLNDLLEKENCFVAVGLSHLMYECGLMNQLKELGYSVLPIEVN